MLFFLPSPLRGLIAGLLLAFNTLFWALPLFVLALLKLLLPVAALRRPLDVALNACASGWIQCNNLWIRLVQRQRWDVQQPTDLDLQGWYLVNCNHRSWVDIFVLQQAFSGRIPLLKFFLKQQLIWVPVVGLAWWALEFPFMKRHSKAALRRNPALRDQDRETTRRACEKFRHVPTSITNFAEGTRFTPAKHLAQGQPYRHLLKPKAGALALAIHAMGAQFRSLVDVTIAYPQGTPTFWDLLCGRAGHAVLRARTLPIPPEFSTSNYEQDKAFRTRFHRWLAQLWNDKDALLDELLPAEAGAARAEPAPDTQQTTPIA
ncbi:acyltransferase [Xenophilus arseniciresistens]|uniref:Acyltransferase n=1 Tax=Xenophilus arseniciresistens TaxID=1283306 RepID=A0AAE3NG73_9BURK|nr:acyltransferase [Xenophilus arseniciresistens]MDA7419084.1 acyltransferase [Xenophilus arseniciresistens]